MKKIVFIFLALCASTVIKAQSLPLDTLDHYENVRMFYKGCMKIREGDSLYLQQDTIMGRRAFAKAMDLLNEEKNVEPKIRINDLVMSDTINNSDEVSLVSKGFNYDYAKTRYDYPSWTSIWVARGVLRAFTPGSKCSVKEIRLRPHGVSIYGNKNNFGKCIIIAVAEYGATVKLKIQEKTSGIVHDGGSFEKGGVSFTKWVLNTNEDFIFRIENTSDKEATIVLISN